LKGTDYKVVGGFKGNKQGMAMKPRSSNIGVLLLHQGLKRSDFQNPDTVVVLVMGSSYGWSHGLQLRRQSLLLLLPVYSSARRHSEQITLPQLFLFLSYDLLLVYPLVEPNQTQLAREPKEAFP
jgi:hypothetical protein